MYKILLTVTFSFVILGCDSNSSNNSSAEAEIKYGIVSNSCGPSDAPVIDIRLTDEEIDCSTDIRKVSNISSYLEFTNTEDIAIGMMLEPHTYSGSGPMSATDCDIGFENCSSIGLLSIEITGQESDTLEGDYLIQNNSENNTGNFIIKRCNNERPLCG